MNVYRYEEFINEAFFRKIKKNKNSLSKSDSIKLCSEEIINFLNDNNIYTWNNFLGMSPFKREVINKMIDVKVDSLKEVKEVIFLLKLELCNRSQLQNLISEYESEEDYEKCSQILKKLNEK